MSVRCLALSGTPTPKAQRTLEKRGQKDIKSQRMKIKSQGMKIKSQRIKTPALLRFGLLLYIVMLNTGLGAPGMRKFALTQMML